jgi:hypothetical protein
MTDEATARTPSRVVNDSGRAGRLDDIANCLLAQSVVLSVIKMHLS